MTTLKDKEEEIDILGYSRTIYYSEDVKEAVLLVREYLKDNEAPAKNVFLKFEEIFGNFQDEGLAGEVVEWDDKESTD